MPQNAWQQIAPQTIHDIVQQTFSLLLQWEACPRSVVPEPREDDLSMAVYCDPFQQSAVIVRCSHDLACRIASQMLEVDPPDLCEEDRVDAVGELVNVIAGTLRGLLPVLQVMSTPFRIAPRELELIAAKETGVSYGIEQEPFCLYTVMQPQPIAA